MTDSTVIVNVDDQDAPRYVKTRDLQEAGFTVIEARTGAEALRLIEVEKPPIVLLDVELPDITGYDVCAFIKKKWPAVMVLMTSSTFTTSTHRTRGLDSGADSYLVQPAEPLELAAAVNALLRIRRAEDNMRALNATLEQRIRDRVADLEAANLKLQHEIEQRQRAETALVQSQKMEAIGQLTGGLAHDFNNLLTAVVGNLDLIRMRASDPRIARQAEHAFKAAERGSKLTAQLLAFSRTQKLVTAPVDLNALITGMGELVNQTLGAEITVKTELAEGLPHALADANQLELAILNLSINARDAMPGGGTLTISTRPDHADKGRVIVCVADTGTGMPPEVVTRAFDPFFTTKPPGKGTGLGLSQVYGIVRQLGGDVTIDTAPGKGTGIRIALRIAHAPAEHESTGPSDVSRGSENILIVDDDPDVRDIMSSVLSDLGYQVREATSGDTALDMLKDYRPDLLILDFGMPGANGAEVAASARAMNVGLRILFVSGYSDTSAIERAVGKAALLHKPFRPAEFAAAVRSSLDAPPPSASCSRT
ncbi:response regulator [Bradyrhizobium sp. Tv2a-2]|uniref:response regulator n=1 Tax=Bradyrhizobium sp. Tv2a-2 TaxID=113395 RepID=UPI00042115C6|nr:response regulator [Bradyrhizobium sp. Tv2a-2]